MSSGKIIKIRDPIYGFIELDDQEREIIDSPYFQRLRRIKQLSLTEMVYPGACHTRFEHSLGVMQMASDMFDNLVKNKDNLELLNLHEGQKERIRKILRLAALLHDIGHSPFSHAGEDIMPNLPDSHPDFDAASDKVQKYNHEHYGHAIIRWLYKDTIETHPLAENHGISVDDVLLLLGDKTIKKQQRTLMILKELISGQVDADRADYLLRDSLHIGVNYGIYDRNRLVNCITLGKTESEAVVLAIEDKGWHIAESLVIARYQMFSQVYFHKVRRIFDFHVSNALGEVIKNLELKDGMFPPPESLENLKEYLKFDDWLVYGAFKMGMGGEHGEHILNRTPYRKVDEWEESSTGNIDERIEDCKKKHSGKNYHIDKNVSTKWYKLDKDIPIRFGETIFTRPLSEKSQIVKTIGQPSITRFYVQR